MKSKQKRVKYLVGPLQMVSKNWRRKWDRRNVMDLMLETPLINVLMFQQSELMIPAEEIVAGLLRQVHNKV